MQKMRVITGLSTSNQYSERAMTFDARSARALSRRIHSVQDCLFLMKQHVVQAAQAGEYEVTVGLSESLPVVAGQSVNSAAFVIDFLARAGRDAWAEAAAQAVQAGYGVRPSWGRTDAGAALEGLTLSWRHVEYEDPRTQAAAPQMMRADHALAMSQAEQTHVRWVDAQREAIQRAAQRGQLSVSLHDALPADAPAWAKRREILARGGFGTELIADDAGATLVVSW
jgi:hypothetical protein